MKRKQTAIISGMLVAFCLGLSGNKLWAQTEVPDAGPVSMTVALVGSSTLSLGEPVLLKYVVKNSSEQPASVFTADTQHKPLITEQFVEVGGKPLVPSVSRILPRKKTDVLRGWDGLTIGGNSSWTWESLASARVSFPHPGNYVLRVHAQNPYVLGDIDQGTHLVLSGDYVFPLKVVAAKPAYLHDTAERLRQRLLHTLDVSERTTLIKALFSMPESSVAGTWQSLVEEPKLDNAELNEIGTALADLMTIKASDILAELFWDPVQSSSALEGASISEHLYDMYDFGDPALRKHIEDLHKQHGVAMSHYRME